MDTVEKNAVRTSLLNGIQEAENSNLLAPTIFFIKITIRKSKNPVKA
jgi:hypothetical protein